MSVATESKDDKEKEPTLEWDDPSIREAQPEYDPDADANFYRLPPDTQDYQVKIKLGERGIYPKHTDKSGAFAVAELELEFVVPGEWFDGRRAGYSEYVNSITQKQTGTSSLVDLLRLILMAEGKSVPKFRTLPELAEFAKEVLGAEPIVGARFQWQAISRDVQDAFKNEDDENHQKYMANRFKDGAFLQGMRNFPQNDEGEYLAEVKCPITDAEIRARLKLLKFVKA